MDNDVLEHNDIFRFWLTKIDFLLTNNKFWMWTQYIYRLNAVQMKCRLNCICFLFKQKNTEHK